MSTPPRVLLLSGSPRRGSYTLAAVRAAARCLQEAGARPLVWDLAGRPLPIVDAACHGRPDLYSGELPRKLPMLAARVDAFVLASPTYHGAYSGALKNALDHLDIRQVRGKPVGLLAHGENLSAVQVCDGLRTVVRALGGIAVPEQLVTVPGDFARREGDEQTLVAPAALDRLRGTCEALVRLTRRLPAPVMSQEGA